MYPYRFINNHILNLSSIVTLSLDTTLDESTYVLFPTNGKIVVNVTCTTDHPEIGTAWLVNDDAGNGTGVVYSVSNTYTFRIALADFGDIDKLVYPCVAYDPDSTERVILSNANVEFRRLFGKYTLWETVCLYDC